MPVERLLVLGNGFDLNINYRTKYSDFARKVKLCWPFNEKTDGLGGYLQQRAGADEWLDLESSMLDYASLTCGEAKRNGDGYYSIDSDKEDFQLLVWSLRTYIKRMIDEDAVDTKSIAANVLRTILRREDAKIYSFNYTNLKKIASALFVKDSRYSRDDFNLEYTPIHGCIETDDIILGVNNDAQLIDGYEFLIKNRQPHYRCTDLRQDLFSAKEITFFGLSMGKIDYPYFKDFWDSLSHGIVPKEQKRHITIFTYDGTSRCQIIKNLCSLTCSDLSAIQSNSYFEIICTELCSRDDGNPYNQWLVRNSIIK